MALSDKDINKIGEIVEVKVTGLETKITKEFGLLRLEMNQRFDEADTKNEKAHQQLLTKIEEVKQMETEDIQALSIDIVKIKKKIAFQ